MSAASDDSPTRTMTRDELLAFVAADPALTRLLHFARERMDDDPGHDLAHCLRVAIWAVALGESTDDRTTGVGVEPNNVDPREAIAAALLHDIVNVPKDSPDRARASDLCADLARRELPAFGFTAAAVSRIGDAIRDHSYSRGAIPESPLGQALQDADRLEALGVIGVFRCISTGTRMGARYFHDEDPFAEHRELDDRAFSIDHFTNKLFKLPATMLTTKGRAEAERRARVLSYTLSQLAIELGQPITDASRVRPVHS
jgi:uncharacterized protein